MLIIPCPYCGTREEVEFSYSGQAHIVRPTNTSDLSDAEWADYLFNRNNEKGIHLELWQHAVGCRQFFNVARNTIDNTIIESYEIGDTHTQKQSGEPS